MTITRASFLAALVAPFTPILAKLKPRTPRPMVALDPNGIYPDKVLFETPNFTWRYFGRVNPPHRSARYSTRLLTGWQKPHLPTYRTGKMVYKYVIQTPNRYGEITALHFDLYEILRLEGFPEDAAACRELAKNWPTHA